MPEITTRESMQRGAHIAEAKGDTKPAGAPIRLMTQFLRAVSESRMEDALALAQTILTFEPGNATILDYQATLAQYINNERELKAEQNEEDGDNTGDGSSSMADEDEESGSEEFSTEGPSGDDESHDHTPQGSPTGDSNDELNHACEPAIRKHTAQDEQEEQRLGGMLRDLRQRRTAGNQEAVSRWNEDKFSACRKEVENVLWKFLPEDVKQAAEKRAEERPSSPPDRK